MSARIYVGTYAKYNSGSIDGKWFDLEDYSDIEEFTDACQEYHGEDEEHEFMFQDYEGIPKELIGESWISPEIFTWLNLDEDYQELLEAYMDCTGDCFADNIEELLESAQERFCGIYRDGAEFAEEYSIETGSIPDNIPNWIVIDWESTWNCNLRFDFMESETDRGTYFFHNY